MGYYQRLRDLREDNDLQQKNMVDIIKKSVKQYGRYERGEVDIPFQDAIKLAKHYKVSLDYIAGLTNNPKNNSVINNTGKVANSGSINTVTISENRVKKSHLSEAIDDELEVLEEEEKIMVLSYIYKLKKGELK